jgi:hypothetical protein
MASAAENLAEFEKLCAELAQIAESIPEDDLRSVTDAEGWPVATVVHHVASAIPFIVGFAVDIAAGGEITWTQEFIDDVNATHLEFFSDADRAESVELLRENASDAAKRLRLLSDVELARRAPAPLEYTGGTIWCAADVIERMALLHVQSHLASIRATVAGA